MRKAGLPIQKILGGQALLQISHDLNYADIDTLYAAVGDGLISSNSVVEKLMSAVGAEDVDDPVIADLISNTDPGKLFRRSASGVTVEGTDDVLIKLARCCTPVPGDAITGFVTRGSGVSVHRSDCVNVIS